MLEKIGLPPKPSLKGNDWVVDSSHCQVCQSQFTFFNRKHHCRRCGGLFCNNCTLQRMRLRGQGDLPVRICDSCKKIEEETRYEMRFGHKNRKARGNSSVESKNEEQLLNDILEEAKQSIKSSSIVHDMVEAGSSAHPSMREALATPDTVEDVIRNISFDEVGSNSPEELRRLAQEERSRHKILKSQGKSNEALAAFKRGKELERQAAAMEIALRKSRKVASRKSGKSTEDNESLVEKKQTTSLNRKSEKDDLANELREMGWTETDVHEVERNPGKQSLESELSSLIGESHKKRKAGGIDKTQVIAHKKKALEFKREGKLTEAKEELKLAKMLEKQLEEQQFMAEAEESDDEISALIRSMENDRQKPTFDDVPGHSFNLDFSRLGDDIAFDDNFDITEDDLNDPEMAAALKSFGWSEEDAELDQDASEDASGKDHKKLAEEVLALKREAVKQKKDGNLAMARDILRKAKLLEKSLESSKIGSQEDDSTSLQNTAAASENSVATYSTLNQPPKSRSALQRELLVVKRKALALKREGCLEEAEEELRKGKVLELQLEEMDRTSVALNSREELGRKNLSTLPNKSSSMMVDPTEGGDADVTDQDMQDPMLLSALKNLGWKDTSETTDSAKQFPESLSKQLSSSANYVFSRKQIRSKAEIQRELLVLKRKVLALKREGKPEEAEQEQRKAMGLENELKELDVKLPEHKGSSMMLDISLGDDVDVTDHDMEDPTMLSDLKNLGWKEDVGSANMTTEIPHLVSIPSDACVIPLSSLKPINKGEIQRELLLIKRKALALRRQGKTEEAEEEQRKAVHLDNQLSELEAKHQTDLLGKNTDNLGRSGGTEAYKEIPKEKANVKYEHDLLEKNDENVSSVYAENPLFGKGVLDGQGSQHHDLSCMSTDIDRSYDDAAVESLGGSEKEKSLVEPPTADSGLKANLSVGQNPGDPLLVGHPSDESARLLDLLTGDYNHQDLSKEVTVVSVSRQNLNLVDLLSNDEVSDKLVKDPRPCYIMDENPQSLDAAQAKNIDQSPEKHVGQKIENEGHHHPPSMVFSQSMGKETPAAEKAVGGNVSIASDSPKDKILALKKRAVALKREGRLAEALEELKQAKLLQLTLEADTNQVTTQNQRAEKSSVSDHKQSNEDNQRASPSTSAGTVVQKGSQVSSVPVRKPSSHDRFKLQQECLSKKRQAAKLRREGKADEAEALLVQARDLQAQIEELDGLNANITGSTVEDDASVESFLDPQLLSALESIGIGVGEPAIKEPNSRTSSMYAKVASSSKNAERVKIEEQMKSSSSMNTEKVKMEQQMKAERLRALNFKKAGKQAEALECLRAAKLLEKKLASLG